MYKDSPFSSFSSCIPYQVSYEPASLGFSSSTVIRVNAIDVDTVIEMWRSMCEQIATIRSQLKQVAVRGRKAKINTWLDAHWGARKQLQKR